MLQLIYELRKNCCGRVDGWTEKSKVLQEVLADLKIEFCVLTLERRGNESLSTPFVQLQYVFRCSKVFERVVSMKTEAISWSNLTRFAFGILENMILKLEVEAC